MPAFKHSKPKLKHKSPPSTNARDFNYEPLDHRISDAIRLLRVNGIDVAGRVDCTLRNTRISECLSGPKAPVGQSADGYLALSYVWIPEGDSGEEMVVVVNGGELRIRKNLYDFLVRIAKAQVRYDRIRLKLIRYYDPSSSVGADPDGLDVFDQGLFSMSSDFHHDRGLWIDAICLNQDDVSERNHQVKHMSKIYQSAEAVLIWLGEGDATVEQWLDMLDSNSCRFFYEDQAEARSEFWKSTGGFNLIRLRYWSRAWVLQELLSSRETILMYGNRLMHASTLLSEFRSYNKDTFMDQPASMHLIPLVGGRDDLIVMLQRYRYTQASDARDRIYSLLAYVKHADHFEIRYEERLEQLAVRAALHFTDGDVHFLEDVMKLLLISLISPYAWGAVGFSWHQCLPNDEYPSCFKFLSGVERTVQALMERDYCIRVLCLHGKVSTQLRLKQYDHLVAHCFWIANLEQTYYSSDLLGPITPNNTATFCKYVEMRLSWL